LLFFATLTRRLSNPFLFRKAMSLISVMGPLRLRPSIPSLHKYAYRPMMKLMIHGTARMTKDFLLRDLRIVELDQFNIALVHKDKN